MNRTHVVAIINTALLVLPFVAFAQHENQPQPGVYCPQLTRDLKFRDTDATTGGQVTELQKFLADYYEDYPDWAITGNFRGTTLSFVQRFQREQNLPAYGYVGPLTRAAIQRVCSGATLGSTTNLLSFSASPTSGTAPLTVSFLASFGDADPGTFIVDFGDGQSSNFAPPLPSSNGRWGAGHTYAAAGIYTAILTRRGFEPAPILATVIITVYAQTTKAVCTFNNQTVAHNASVTAYQFSSVAYGQQCLSEQRTCTNGTLSGTYQYATCTVQAPLQGIAPIITGKNTDDAYPGDSLTITGTGFTGQNDILIDNIVQQTSVASTNNGTALSFLIPASYPGSETNHVLKVRNQNGTSNGSTLRVHVRTATANAGACTYKGQSYAEGASITVPYVNQPGATLSLTCDNTVWVLGALNNLAAGANICDLGWGSSDLGCGPYTGTPAEYISATPRHGSAALTVTIQTRASRDYATFCEQYSISWGDGRSDTNNPTGIPHCPYSDVGKTVTHTYATPGSYAIGYSTSVHGPSALAYIRVDGPVTSAGNQFQFASAFSAFEPILQAILKLFGR